jgi:hypothetical protein
MLDTSKWPVVQHHEVQEIFCDGLAFMTFDGHTMRINLSCARPEDPKPPKIPTGERHVVARLVIAPPVMDVLLKQLMAIAQHIQKQGNVPMPSTGEVGHA